METVFMDIIFQNIIQQQKIIKRKVSDWDNLEVSLNFIGMFYYYILSDLKFQKHRV